MKTKQTASVVPTASAPVSASGFTLGLDLGDRKHHVCVLNAAGDIVPARGRTFHPACSGLFP